MTVCIVAHCSRRPASGELICSRCWPWVSAETKLALEGHQDELKRTWFWPPEQRDGWRAFVTWSWRQTVSLAALEAFETKQLRALEFLKARQAPADEAA